AERALGCWRRAGDREREGALLARRSMYLWGVGRSVEALESAAAAVAMLEAAPPGPALASAYTHLASMRMLAREVPGAIEAGGRAIELAERFGQHEQLSRALNAVGSAQWFSDPDQAPLTLGRSLEVAREHGYDQLASIAMTNLGSGAGEIRRYAPADRWLRDAIAWSAERDLDANRRYANAWLARCHFAQGRWSEAGHDGGEPGRRAPGDAAQPHRGPHRARPAADTAGRPRRPGAPGGGLGAGHPDRGPAADLAGGGRAGRAGLARRPAGGGARAGRRAVRAGPPAGPRVGHRRAGVLAVAGGRAPRPARRRGRPLRVADGRDWRAAAEAWRALGCPYELALALADSAAEGDLLAALDLLERLGARPAADTVAARLRELGVRRRPRRPRRATLANPAGLTTRELDVLAMLGQGLRNADIASRLHIAEKTVDHHVSAILAKLGVRSRREAARAASARGIVPGNG
ncbi:MAG TPA: helix-turn-helix transcriptional regulator, partial [Actinomycetota bacterium]|nr:helix-turn-helix transcriptional regulator [Actinomycetota bacterium]